MIAGLLRYPPPNPSGDTLVGRLLPDDYRTLLAAGVVGPLEHVAHPRNARV